MYVCIHDHVSRKSVSVSPTMQRLLFVYQIEGVTSWSVGEIKTLFHLGERPTQMFGIADSFTRLQSKPL